MFPELVLLTYEFPFGGRETFLETEILHVAPSFSTVWIIPSRAVWSPKEFAKIEALRRVTPANVRVLLPPKGERAPQSFGRAFAIALRAQIFRGPGRLFFKRFFYSLREGYKAAILSSFIQRHVSSLEKPLYGYAYWMVESAVALGWLKRMGVVEGFVARGHRGDLYDEDHPAGRRLYNRFLFETCDRMVPISEHGAAHLRRSGCSEARILVSRLGVKIGPRTPHRLDAKRLCIASCSNLIPVKRVALLAEALQILRIPFEWHHFGDGIQRGTVARLITAMPKNGRAVLHGWAPNHEVVSYYRNNPVDVFVNISISEGVPVSIMEAMAAGVPVLATAVCGTPELVDESCGELLSPDLDCHTLAQALEKVWYDRVLWAERGHAARLRAESLCDGAQNYRQFSSTLVRLAEDAARGSIVL